MPLTGRDVACNVSTGLDTIPFSQIIKPNRRPHQKHRQRKVDWRRLLERRVAPAETCAQPKPVEVPSRAVRVKNAADAPFCSPNRNPSVTGEADVSQRRASREPAKAREIWVVPRESFLPSHCGRDFLINHKGHQGSQWFSFVLLGDLCGMK